MPFGCTICLVSLEKCPTSESSAPTDGLTMSQSVGITAGPCGHVFHTVCIMQWMQCGEGCPYCRETFEEDEMQELFYNKLDDDAPAIAWDANVDEETDIETLRTALKNIKYSKQVDETIIKNLRSEVSRVNSRWCLERTQAEKQKEHLRLSFRNQERKLAETESQRDIYRANLDDMRRLREDLECVLYAERLEATVAARRWKQEIECLNKRNTELEVESVRLLDQNQCLNRRIKDLRDIDQLINLRVQKRMEVEATRLRDSSDSDSIYSTQTCQLARNQQSPGRLYARRCKQAKRIRRSRTSSEIDQEDIIRRPRSRPSDKKRPMVIESETEPDSSSDESMRISPKRRRMNSNAHSCSRRSRRSVKLRRNLRSFLSPRVHRKTDLDASFSRRCNRRIESDYSD